MADNESPYRISGLAMRPEGVEISYLRLQDVKENGLMFTRTVLVPHGADYDDELDRLGEAVITLIADAEDDEQTLDPLDLNRGEEDEEAD